VGEVTLFASFLLILEVITLLSILYLLLLVIYIECSIRHLQIIII